MSNERIEAIKKDLIQQITDQSEYGDLDKASWNYEEGVILSINNAATLLDHIDKLESALDGLLKSGIAVEALHEILHDTRTGNRAGLKDIARAAVNKLKALNK